MAEEWRFQLNMTRPMTRRGTFTGSQLEGLILTNMITTVVHLRHTWQNLYLRLFNVLPATAKNVTDTHFKKVVLKWLVYIQLRTILKLL